LLRALSNLALNVSRDEASNTSLGNLFQCFTTPTVKEFFLISSLNLPSFSLKPVLLVLSLQALLKSLSPLTRSSTYKNYLVLSYKCQLFMNAVPPEFHLSKPLNNIDMGGEKVKRC